MASCLLDLQGLRGLEVSMVSRGCSAAALGRAGRWMETLQCLKGRPNVAPRPPGSPRCSWGFGQKNWTRWWPDASATIWHQGTGNWKKKHFPSSCPNMSGQLAYLQPTYVTYPQFLLITSSPLILIIYPIGDWQIIYFIRNAFSHFIPRVLQFPNTNLQTLQTWPWNDEITLKSP